MQEKQKKELFSQFYEQHLKAKYEKAPRYTLEEIAAHNTEQDCWTVVHGKVYNIAPFIAQHPGGKKILRAAGIDGTEIFSKINSLNKLFRNIPQKHQIGRDNAGAAIRGVPGWVRRRRQKY